MRQRSLNGLTKTERKRGKAVARIVRAAWTIVRTLKVLGLCKQFLECHTHFEPCHGSALAKMNALAPDHTIRSTSLDVDDIRIIEGA